MMGYYESRGITTNIPRNELVDRRVYLLISRNLSVGAWNEANGGFIGIREKFGREYLFTEYFSDGVSPVGTASALKDLGVVVADGIPMDESLMTDDGGFLKDDKGYVQTNAALFDLLQPLDKASRDDYAQWWKDNAGGSGVSETANE